jgi:hypothetical protein
MYTVKYKNFKSWPWNRLSISNEIKMIFVYLRHIILTGVTW